MAIEAYDPSCVLDLRMIPFYDGGAQKIYDHSGYGNHGTPQNFVGDDSEYVNGSPGQSFNSGGSAYLDAGNAVSLQINLSLSLECCITFISFLAAERRLISKASHLTLTGYEMTHGNATGVTALKLNGISVLFGTLVPAIPYHLIGTYDGTTARTYVNGIPINAGAIAALTDSGGNFQVSNLSSLAGRQCNGIFHRVRVFSRAIGAAEVTERYAAWVGGRL